MKRHRLAVVADAAFLVACLFILYTSFGGEVRWKTALFRITLTEPNRPIQICILALLIKAVSGLNRGLFASLATTRLPIVGPLSAFLHALDQRLRALFLAYRMPLLVSATSLLLSLGLLELYLRWFPHTLPHALGNHVATGYHTNPSGIYRYAPELRTNLMRPNHERTLKTFGVSLRPRYVFLFFLANDIDDLGLLTDGEMSAFLNTPLVDHSTPYFDVRRQREWDVESYLADLYVAKAFDFLRGYVRARWRTPAEASEDVLRPLPPVPGDPGSTLAMRFHLYALRKIQNLAVQNRFAFVNVFAYSGHIPDESAYEKILEAFCRAHGIAFLSLRPAFEQALRNGEEVFLREDGHLSDGGARLAAQVLAQYIDDHPTPRSGQHTP